MNRYFVKFDVKLVFKLNLYFVSYVYLFTNDVIML